MVPDPAGSTDKALRVQLGFGDAFNDGASITTRVELVNDLTKGNFTAYVPGDDFYFAFDVYFPSVYFDHWHCTDNAPAPLPPSYDGRCPNGVPDTASGIYSAWNVVTQWHGPGGPSMGFNLQRLYASTQQQYQLNLSSFDGGIWHDSGDPSKGGAIWTDTWYHFVVHIRFGTPGLMELWEAVGSGPLIKQTFNGTHNDQIPGFYSAPACSSVGDGTACTANTVDTTNAPLEVYLKQGHYRNPTVTDSTTLFYNNTKVGDFFGDVAPSSPPPAGASCTPAKPAVATLSDSFGGSGVDSTKWAAPTQTLGTVTVSGGFLHQTPNANVSGANLLLQSGSVFSLIGSAAYVQAAQVIGNGGVDQNFTLLTDGSNLVSWLYENGTLHARKVVAGVSTYIASVTYSATTHAWWRIRETAGSVYWETSPDRQTWSVVATALTSEVPFVCSIKVTFFTETWGTGSASPGEARYANFNVAPAAPPPPGNPWVDSFNGTAVDTTKWSIFTFDGGTITEGGGAIRLTPAPNTADSVAQLKSVNTASLIGNAASVKAVGVLNGSNDCDEDFSLMLTTGRSNRVSWYYEHGSLSALYVVNGVQTLLVTLTYSPTAHLYWKIRESGGTVFWETSSDGLTWTQQASVPTATLFSLTSVSAQLYAETWSFNTAAPGSAHFADLR